MKYQVTGINHSKGARMTLELEAESKAGAEKKAHDAGMDVQHIQAVANGEQPNAERQSHRGEDMGGGVSALLVKVVFLLAIAGLIVWGVWAKLRGMMH